MDIDDEERLATSFASLASALLRSEVLKSDLMTLLGVASRMLPQCSGGSVALLVEGEPSTEAVTDRVSLEVDMVQYDAGEGPCVMALGGSVIRVGYVPDDQRFPHFAAGAADRRVLSVLSTPIVSDGAVLGTLNLYSREANAFDDDAAGEVALVLTAEAATAIAKSE